MSVASEITLPILFREVCRIERDIDYATSQCFEEVIDDIRDKEQIARCVKNVSKAMDANLMDMLRPFRTACAKFTDTQQMHREMDKFICDVMDRTGKKPDVLIIAPEEAERVATTTANSVDKVPRVGATATRVLRHAEQEGVYIVEAGRFLACVGHTSMCSLKHDQRSEQETRDRATVYQAMFRMNWQIVDCIGSDKTRVTRQPTIFC